MSPPNLQHLTELLLGHLRHEESLLRSSRQGLLLVHHALRQGDLKSLELARPDQERLAADLREASICRGTAADQLAAAIGLPGQKHSLAQIADRLPLAQARELSAIREKLQAIVGEVLELQRANANLVQTLRSYFRGVLSGLAPAETPARYGPTGGRLQPIG